MNPSVVPLSTATNLSRRLLHAPLRFRAIWAIGVMIALLFTRAAFATTYTVTDTADSATDTGSLRYAVNTAVDGDTIQFLNAIGTITLTNGTLNINHSITITGPGAGLLTVSGNNVATVFAVNSGTVSISGLTIANGNASGSGYGGGILNGGTLTLTGCILFNNTSPANNGGGIYSTGTLTVVDSTFSGNTTAPGAGGGGAIASGGPLTVQSSTFSGNTSAAGGAILAQGISTVENSTFFGNDPTTGPGGGIFNGGTMTVSNSTITGNSVDGIWNNGNQPLTVLNSIVSGNTGSDCDNCGVQSANNLIGGTADLGPLQYNGWITKTMMPLPGSPAIGAGSGSTLATDQRGFARPIGSGVASDLGAVQTNYFTVSNLNDTGAGSLRQAIANAIASAGSSGDIVFQSGLTGTITLAGTLPAINTSNVNIEGPGANVVTVSGNSAISVFNVSGNVSIVNLHGLTIANGNSAPPSGMPGGLFNNGVLTIENSAFTGNSGDSGGAILNEGTLVVQDSTFSGNISDNGGGGILNQRTLIAVNTTFNGNRAYNTNGGGVDNPGGTAILDNSTFSGNEVLNGGVGGGIYNTGPLVVENNIVSGNTNLQTNTEDDCTGCSGGANLIGGTANLGQLAYNGLNATVQTMLPLPGSPAIQAGDATQLLFGLTTDERGFPRLTNGKLDLGAAQTNYTAVGFVQQPTTTLVNANISPAVTLNVLETNGNLAPPNNADAVDGIPLTLAFSGTGTLAGTLTQTTSGGVASFGNLSVNAAGTGDTLATSVTVVAGQTLRATSDPFDIVLPTPTVNFNPALPASVTYGVAPITLKATTVNSSGQPTGQTVTFQVDSGPAAVSGNVLTITGVGTVVVEVDAAANGTYNAADMTASILVKPAPLTVTAANAARSYGAANPAFTGTYTGAVNGDTFTVSGTTTATISSPIGTYPITPTAAGTHLTDYTVTYVNGTLTIGQAVLTVTAANATRAYGTPNPVFTGDVTGAVNGDAFNETFSTAATLNSNAGSYPIVPAASGPDLADYTVAIVPGTLTVSKAASKLALAASSTQIAPRTAVTLTATATSTTTGVPTGTVAFSSGSTQLGSATLNAQGVASLVVTTLSAGSNPIAASYGGDINFTGSQAQLNGTILVANPSFNMIVNPLSLAIQRGQSGAATVTLTPTIGYAGTVNLSCSGLPLGSTCQFQPASVTFNGPAAVQVTLAIKINSASQERSGHVAWLRPTIPLRGLPVLPAMFFWVPGVKLEWEDRNRTALPKARSRFNRMMWLIAFFALTASVLSIVGCAGLTPNYPPPGSRTITVIALGSGGISQSAGMQLTIQ